MTYTQQFNSALKCKNVKEAAAWMDKELIRYWEEYGKSKDEARRIILSNLGYMAGYYDEAVARKVYRLFHAEHPIFGPPTQARKVMPGQAYRLGLEMVRKQSAPKI